MYSVSPKWTPHAILISQKTHLQRCVYFSYLILTNHFTLDQEYMDLTLTQCRRVLRKAASTIPVVDY